MNRDAVKESAQRVTILPLVAGQGWNINRPIQLRVPIRNFSEDGVVLASVGAAPCNEAKPVALAPVLQGKLPLGGWPQVPDGQHRSVGVQISRRRAEERREERVRGGRGQGRRRDEESKRLRGQELGSVKSHSLDGGHENPKSIMADVDSVRFSCLFG